MFRNRKNSQKPSSELYAAFKQDFPHVGPGTISTSPSTTSAGTAIPLTSTSSHPPAMDQRHFGDSDMLKDHDAGLGEPDHWRFTPSMLDTNSFAFASFANQHTEDYTPTFSGSINGVVHNQAGDLHTPGMAFGLGTPLSISNSESHTSPASAIDLHGFHPHLLHSQPLHNSDLFAQQQSYAPSTFVHRDSGYETMHAAHNVLSNDDMMEMQEPAKFAAYPARSYEEMSAQPIHTNEKFRYHVTLNAPTAMVKHRDEIPITYLNKGQAYVVTISDNMGLGPAQGPIKYRTVIRISFEDEQQRQRPSSCWQLWKEGRGLAEAHQRSGKLQAVEYVDPNHGNVDDTKRSRVDLEKASFDCFSVTWSPAPGSVTADCTVAVRFNFLSTDFSHSKGVKGIPVRLCAKTEIISSGTPDSPPGPTSEVCFCKVKLFRDHGAERKLSNDVAHIKKTIDKLKQQIAQAENGVKEAGKRKRSAGDKGNSHRPSKAQKHKRTWSVSSQDSTGRPAGEEDLHLKLENMQDMFTSTRPVSVLYLQGYEQDDPDAYPVFLPGEPTDLTKIGTLDRKHSWDRSESTPTQSYVVSPTPSSRSAQTDSRTNDTGKLQKLPPAPSNQHVPSNGDEEMNQYLHSDFPDSSTASIKIPKHNFENSLPGWIDAYEVDPCYQAPKERLVKPVACFYVLIKIPSPAPGNEYYKAVYLMQRTTQNLIASIARKCEVDPNHVIRTLRVNPKGLMISVDDDVVSALSEGQDMVVEFKEVDTTAGLKREPDSGASTPKASEASVGQATTTSLEMRLLF